MPATEVLSMPIKEGCTPEKFLKLIDDVPATGKIFSGLVSGKPNHLRAFLDWESLKAHEAFNASSAFPPFLEEFKKVVAGDFSLWHVDFQPSVQALYKAQAAPVTEVVTFYFSGSPPEGFVETVLRFREEVVAHQPGYVEAALGVTHEEVTFEGEKGHVLVALVGWDSEQSWRTFANSKEYKETNPGQTLEEGVVRGFEMEIVELQAYN